MGVQHDRIRKITAEIIHSNLPDSLTGNDRPTLDEVYNSLVLPPNPDMGDLAFGCFKLAKALKKGPPVIARDLAEKISSQAFDRVEAAGPYVNFRVSAHTFGQQVLDLARRGELFEVNLTEGTPKTMIEYSQPNTHKELHVGHMRNLALGLSLTKMLRYAGYDLITATFPGDMGTHVAKCLWYMKKHNTEAVPEAEKGEWLGRMYSKGNIKLEDEEETGKEMDNRRELTEIINQLEHRKGEYFELWKETREWSIDLMKQVYQWAGADFDVWYFESEVDADSLKFVKKYYDEGKLILSHGAIGMDLSDVNLGFCMLVKSDGTGLYATKDLELARRKFQEYKVEKSIYVVDTRQALHFQQVFKTLERLGFEQAKNCYHLQYNFVELPDGAMSSRKGNIVPILDLIREMENLVKTQYLSRYKGEWTDAEIDQTATEVAQGAIKYGMLRMDNNKKIVFDMKEWLKLDGESGPFIQYSYARIASLDRKLGYNPSAEVNWSLLTHKTERYLAQHLMNFNSIALVAAEEYRPALICSYLYDLAKKFNGFYHECPIGNAETAELKNARLALSAACGAVLKKGLDLLGIPAPERM